VTRKSTIAIFLVAAGVLVLPNAAMACHGENDGRASADAQERTMLCLVNQARSAHGLAPLKAVRSLVKAADHKARTSFAAMNSATKPATANSPSG